VLVIAASVVVILVRFVRLFFDAVERGETAVAWLPRDLTGPTSAIVRFGIVTGALIFLAPLVSGSTEGPIGRSGAILFAAIGLAATPFLANGMLGFAVVFGRRLRPGLYVEIGAYGGRIVTIGLQELRLEDADRFEVRVPHLYSLRHPLRVLGPSGRVSIEIGVAPSARQGDVRELLLRTAQAYAREARVELLSADADAVRYRVAAAADGSAARSDLHFAVLEALRAAEIPLGRAPNGGAHA
jgi:small-conductance mechanosensitive channel